MEYIHTLYTEMMENEVTTEEYSKEYSEERKYESSANYSYSNEYNTGQLKIFLSVYSVVLVVLKANL